ncbi:DNA replication protein [Alicyclobacillus contaminans]|uniref:DnaD domain-containing protein n=1 Tax=Alicyclobacillus contaminans TaxID=392016 RepID=UPI0004044356|nr:DnaD domain protein [Alicyclobacillus contaminans]GMA48736.1 DNA replication protein [Alicyclobacillus contaminans]
MKPSERENANADFLGSPFLSLPRELMKRYPELSIGPAEFLVLLQIITSIQVDGVDFLTPQELGQRCGMDADATAVHMERLVERGLLSIGERIDDQQTHSAYFDLKPLWQRLRGRDPLTSPVREWRKDAITLFEEEFGRPLSYMECDQIRQWMERDGHPEWLIVEALREAVFANKFSFRYIDRVLFDWYRNGVRTKAELEAYRENYRERAKSRAETAASQASRSADKPKAGKTPKKPQHDERYSAFYQLFPDS